MCESSVEINVENLAKIEEHRGSIDAIDHQLVELLNERAFHSLTIRNLKPGAGMKLFDPKREDAIYDKVCALNKGPLADENVKEIYATLLKVMKEAPSLPAE